MCINLLVVIRALLLLELMGALAMLGGCEKRKENGADPGGVVAAPVGVISVSPRTVHLGVPTIFTVNGVNLPVGLDFSIEGCASLREVVDVDEAALSSQRQFECSFAGKPGQRAGMVKQRASSGNNTILWGGNFSVNVTKGFSFSRVATGDCIKDNRTNLMWENKTNDNGLRDKKWRYSWYSPGSADNEGDEESLWEIDHATGKAINTCGNTLGQCNTHAYVAALNASHYCGYSDWRMPEIDELESIVDFSKRAPGPAIDTTYFPHTLTEAYLSASPGSGSQTHALACFACFPYAYFYWGNPNDYPIRAVRSAR